jgi:hypothetical protein
MLVAAVLASADPAVVSAALAFIAATAATAVGYRQWRKQQDFDRSKAFLTDRAAAYKELWTRLEAIHVRLLKADVTDAEFDDEVRDLNTFVLSSEIYFDPGIRARVKSYYDSARKVSRVINSYPLEELRRERGLTEEAPLSGDDMREVVLAVGTADEARTAIMAEVRTHIGGS